MSLRIPPFLKDKDTWDYYGPNNEHRSTIDAINTIFSG